MPEPYVAWILAGFVLVIAELLTGTFFLLVLGLAAFAGGLMAVYSPAFYLQALTAAVVAVVGTFWVKSRRRLLQEGSPMASLDIGQSVSFETWINPVARHARVRYRDTRWDAFIENDASGASDLATAPGDVFYIVGMEGNTLTVSRQRAPSVHS